MIDIKLLALVLLIGIILGFLLAAKIGIGDTNIENNIGKIKGNDGTVNVEQKQPVIEPKKPLVKRVFQSIFTRKNKSK